ncbi:MAG: hypothetical protein ABIR63_06125, partial [Sphingomicrobium sp.]
MIVRKLGGDEDSESWFPQIFIVRRMDRRCAEFQWRRQRQFDNRQQRAGFRPHRCSLGNHP